MVLALVLFGLFRFVVYISDGFWIGNIYSDWPNQERFVTHALKDKEELKRILSQKFTYLAKGFQSYVFESEDGEWVLKFPKFQRYRLNPLHLNFPLPKSLDEKRQETVQHYKNRIFSIFDSWKLAYEEFQEDTEIFYVHINKSDDLGLVVTIVDKLGFSYQVPLDQMTFMVQRKAHVLGPYLHDLYERKDFSAMHTTLHKLLELVVSEFKRGVIEKDVHLIRNTAIYGDKVIHIDPARYVRDENMRDPKNWKAALKAKMVVLEEYLKTHFPEVYPYFIQEIDSIEKFA